MNVVSGLEFLEMGNGLYVEVVNMGFGGDIFVFNVFISMYVKCGSLVNV